MRFPRKDVISRETPHSQVGAARLILLVVLACAAAGFLVYLMWSRPQATSQPPAPPAPGPALAGSIARSPQGRISGDPLAQDRATLAAIPANSPILAHLSLLLDGSQPATQRRKAARSLAQLGTAEAVSALKIAFMDAPTGSRIAAAEALGACAHPEAFAAAKQLVETAEERFSLAAIRGLGDRGDAAAAEVLGQVLLSEDRSESARIEAALSLGTIGDSAGGQQAIESLLVAAGQIRDEAILQPVLDGLAGWPFEKTRAFFAEYLNRSNVPSETKVLALEALGRAGESATELLLQYAAHSDTQLRAAAALGLAASEATADLSGHLVNLTRAESDPLVRSRLYQALTNQENPPAADVLGLVRGEKEPTARLSALALAASLTSAAPHHEIARFFNEVAVPELTRAALSAPQPGDRLVAIMALNRAGTEQAAAAVTKVAQETKDPQIIEVLRSAAQNLGQK